MGPAAKAAVPAITKLLDDKDPEVRMQSALALAEIGPDAIDAAPALVNGLADKAEAVRYASAYAVGKIGADRRNSGPGKKRRGERSVLENAVGLGRREAQARGQGCHH